MTANPKLAEMIIKAHAEAIKRFYDDKAFAVKAYIAFDKQPEADVARIYDHRQGQRLERVPYVLAAAIKSVTQQANPQAATQLKAFDFHKIIDNSIVDRLVKEGFFEQLSARHQGRAAAQGEAAFGERQLEHRDAIKLDRSTT